MAAPRYQKIRPKHHHFWVSQHDNFFELRTHGGGYLVQKFPACVNVRDMMQVVKSLGCKNMAEVLSDLRFLLGGDRLTFLGEQNGIHDDEI